MDFLNDIQVRKTPIAEMFSTSRVCWYADPDIEEPDLWPDIDAQPGNARCIPEIYDAWMKQMDAIDKYYLLCHKKFGAYMLDKEAELKKADAHVALLKATPEEKNAALACYEEATLKKAVAYATLLKADYDLHKAHQVIDEAENVRISAEKSHLKRARIEKEERFSVMSALLGIKKEEIRNTPVTSSERAELAKYAVVPIEAAANSEKKTKGRQPMR